MKCFACGNKKKFGSITATSNAPITFSGKTNYQDIKSNLNSIDIYVCMECGMLLSDMRGFVPFKGVKK